MLGVLQEADATVTDIAERSGLEKRQVRGVANAPDLQNKVIFRQERNGTILYSLTNPKEEGE
ncbi:MAG: hypothetical protein V2B18_20890 [Pseudomonadota bacterium]